ncbi:MAG: conserved rane protein of unknown function [Anaerocolumna sp.]|jgi:hypothetical protein|nr:conserved rane protein of unknown function [Anaerocolumna sp.]
MSDIFKVKIVFSQSHLIMPKIILGILIILGVVIFIQSLMKAKRENRPVMDFKNKKFFEDNYDKVKFYGTIILLLLYVFSMNLLGFILSSIIFLSLFNVLFTGKKDIKSIMKSIVISIIETMVVWFVFGYIFEITLP